MELEGLYRDIVEGSTDGFWLLDLEGNTVYANPALLAMFGYTGEEFGRLSAFDLLDDPGREQFTRHLEEAQRGARHGQDVECMYLRATARRCGCWSARARCGHLTAPWSGSCTGSATTAPGAGSSTSSPRAERQLAEGQRIARIGTWEWDVRRDQITGSEGLRLLYGIRARLLPRDLRARCWRACTRTTGPRSRRRCSRRWPATTSSRSRRGSRVRTDSGSGRAGGAWCTATRPARWSRSRAPTRTSPRPSWPRSRSRTRSSRTP